MSDRTPMAPITQLKRTSTLPSPPRREPRPKPASTPAAPQQQQPQEELPPARRTHPSRTHVGTSTEAQMRPISLSVPAPLLETFKQFAKRTETPQSAVLMDAITAHQDDLSVLVSTSRPAASKEGLFVRDTPRDSVPLSTLSLRMRAVNVDAIDQLVDATGAGSRSHLCVAALAAYLSTNR